MTNTLRTDIVVDGTAFALMSVDEFEAGFDTKGNEMNDLVRDAMTSEAAQPVDEASPLFVWKTAYMVEQIRAVIADVRPTRIFEIGISNGGSSALLAALAPEAKVVAVEIAAGAPALDEHVERRKLSDRIRPYYAVDQADRERIRRIVADEFGEQPIDLVIDDGSHRLDATRSALDALFPLVRPGGCYAIEDWGWAHIEARPSDNAAWLPSGPPMSQLVFELMMVLGSQLDIIQRMDGDMFTTRFWKGNAPTDPESWSLADAAYSVTSIALG